MSEMAFGAGGDQMMTNDLHSSTVQADLVTPPHPRFAMSDTAGIAQFAPGDGTLNGTEGYTGRDMMDAATWHRGPHIASGGMFSRLDEEAGP